MYKTVHMVSYLEQIPWTAISEVISILNKPLLLDNFHSAKPKPTFPLLVSF